MAQLFSNARSDTLFLGGEKLSGKDIRNQNVLATQSISNILKSSLGPIGLDKLLVDDLNEITITNDGSTILNLLNINHPISKILIDLAKKQDLEIGDGTTSIVLICSELLKNANNLINLNLHPTIIINGYKLALKEAINYINTNLSIDINNGSIDNSSMNILINVAKTSLNSKIIGSSDLDSNFFANLIVSSILSIKTKTSQNKFKYPINSINILKAHGKSMLESFSVNGYALNCTIASQQMPKKIINPKIALLDINLQKTKLALGVQIQIDDPNNLEKIRQMEKDLILNKINLILKSGANVILTTKGIDDLCLKKFVENNSIAVRRCNKIDLKRIAKLTGGKLISNLSNLDGEDSFDPSYLGSAKSIEQIRISDDELILINGTLKHSSSSIILRGPNDYTLDEIERSLNDSLNVVKRVLENEKIVPGGGAVETALNIYLENFATTLSSREQLAIAEFANSLLVIPKTLCINAAKDSNDLVGKLRSYHAKSQNSLPNDFKRKNYKNYGLDLFNGKIHDEFENGVIEPTISKVKSLKSAVEACIAILRIDTMINVDPEPPKQDPHDHE
ncbi:chaperonin-containing T-complex alpha subunit TCP1 [Ascoidea rubescens DSM 1968]|uniref:T-complex protein 1 subunit alpha n=1 Tax=Ascoidea rubescens DSM 1968 TaxID=1344418 RepID=A0A1D2V8K8_9ASCO|nr:T-complex protein 1 [Ascoidea rubescens DSM 1968]ODV57954.1 T-complex protein 1 [Ascoidea rubescens DSM 1968]